MLAEFRSLAEDDGLSAGHGEDNIEGWISHEEVDGGDDSISAEASSDLPSRGFNTYTPTHAGISGVVPYSHLSPLASGK